MEKWVTIRKMGHTRKKWSLGKMGHSLKNRLNFEKWVTLKKTWVTLGKLGRSWKNGSVFKK